MAIKDWPPSERPRERLLHLGAGALSDAELLGVVLGRGVAGHDAVDLARRALARYGGLGALVALDPHRFSEAHGLTETKFAILHAALEIGRRALREAMLRGDPLGDAAAARHYLVAQIGGRQREAFCALFLDTRHRVITFETLFEGTIDSATVHPREVVKRVLETNAAAVIFAHNHPSGVCEPSAADRSLTRRLSDALGLIDVRVLDHFVVAGQEVVSFADLGLMP